MSGFSFPLSLPSHNDPTRISIRPRKVVGVNTSPGSLITQTYEWQGERWEADLMLPPMYRDDAEPWIAWLLSMRGSIGSVLLGDPMGALPRGEAAENDGTPQVDGAQTARSRTLMIKTGLEDVEGYLLAGSWFSLGTGSARRLYKILSDVDLDPYGYAELDIWPALRSNVADNAEIFLEDATGRFMLTNSTFDYDIIAQVYQPITIPFIEDLRP